MTAKKQNSTTIADEIVQGLEEFADDLANAPDLSTGLKQYNHHKYVLDWGPVQFDADGVKRIRCEILNVSQSIFAQFLGVSVKAVQAWERGARQATGSTCAFLREIEADPAHWQERLHARLRPVAEEVNV